MSITNSSVTQSQRRQDSLRQLSRFFTKIEFLELNEQDFSTEDLHQLGSLAEYSIHPVFSSKKMYEFYLKISQKYWNSYENIETTSTRKRNENTSYTNQNDQISDVQKDQDEQTVQIQNPISPDSQSQQKDKSSDDQKTTEAIQQVKQVRLQFKVTKSYHEIQKFFLQFDYNYSLQNQKIGPKIQLLNSWTSVPSKLPNFVQKKSVQTPSRIDSATYLQNLKLGVRQSRKEVNACQNNRTIILGKNESTQIKQMKHMLKVQAKTNFVEQKQKEEQKLDILEKKSIELNYLLNIITKDFFDQFFQDILKILRQNVGSIQILCQKVVQKVKEEHNFIQIYVELVKKLSKQIIYDKKSQSSKFNELQKYFVSHLQTTFIKLISLRVEPSCSNFNEYKYQKQIIGMSKFIGKLIKQKVLSKKIFKVCFWEILYRYTEKVKENPQYQIVNQCLIESIVIISDQMTNTELLKLMQKEKQLTNQMDEVIELNKLQRMMMALVNPNDEDHIKRQEEYKNLIETIKVQEYPHILMGLMQIFVSKRMKLKFLVQHWQQKIETLKNSSIEDLKIMEHKRIPQEQVQVIHEQVQEELIQYDKQLKEFVKQIKHDPTINNLGQKNQTKNNQLVKYENLIKRYIQAEKNTQHSKKVLKLLIIEFLKQFADCKNYNTVIRRINYFISFVDSFSLKESSQTFLDIICKDQLQNLMIIECDYPFLVEGLCYLLSHLIEKVGLQKDKLLDNIKKNFDQDDQDMTQFYMKVCSNFQRILDQKDEVLED